MPTPMSASAALDRHFLEMRCRLLDLGAALDRVDRGGEAERVANDERMSQLDEAIRILADGRGDRARRIQMVFSDPYDMDWPRPQKSS